jgi:S-adenosylmethionine hydrolase
MPEPILTLTTDFGRRSPFVAAMKGVIFSINPAARVVDLSHEIPPYDLRNVAFFLAQALPYFPPGTIHVVVVDPGVGTDRSVLFASVAGQRVLAPDNGCWTLLAEGSPEPPRVVRVAEPRFWRPAVSSTFHGRDIFAPVAAHLSLGVDPSELGPAVSSWRGLDWPTPTRLADGLLGEVIFIDDFGNLITNIPGTALQDDSPGLRVSLENGAVARRVRTYGDAGAGELVALISSSGRLEVAEVQGNAARRLGVGVGARVHVESSPRS